MANDDDQKKAEDQRRQEIERIEINSAYDTSGASSDTCATLGAKSSPKSDISISANGTDTVRSLTDEYNDRTDRYGFIHETKLPVALTEIELKRNNIEKMREKKWLQMLKDWQSYYNGRNFDKLISRVYKGIPNSMRHAIWLKFLDIDTQIKAQSGVYEKMRSLARLYSVDLRQIDLDINRTFRNNIAYKKRYNQRQVQLYNILASYSIYNTEIGYCQGMATVTALLLMYLSDEEKTFWALSQLMSHNKYSMHGFFKQDFPKLIRYVDKHDMIIKTFLPKIHKKFIKYNITSLLYTTKWFLQCYLDALPFSLVLRIWDVYLLKGDIVMLAMSYNILKLHKRRLLHKDFDMDKINDFLNHKLPEDFLYSDDEVMYKLEECIDKLQKHRFAPSGPILDAIPQDELPKIPFGDFKKFDKNEILSNIVQKQGVQSRNSLNRSAAVELMAKERLEAEKRKQEEERKLRRQQTLEADNGGLEKILNSNGEPIPNISDMDDDEDDFDMSDSDDDLNPSKISEYDEDRADKESIISNLTRQSLQDPRLAKLRSDRAEASLSGSQLSVDKTSPQLKGRTKAPILAAPETDNEADKTSFVRQPSEYDNSTGQRKGSDYENSSSNQPSPERKKSAEHLKITNIISKSRPPLNNSPQKSHNFNTNVPAKSYAYDKRMQSSDNLIASFTPSRTIPQSQSYIISPNYATASILSSPPPVSPTAFMSSRGQPGAAQSSAHIASIITNPSYYNTNTETTFNHVNYEYVRSPHGIYTRITNNNSSSNASSSGSDNSKTSVKKSPSFRIMPHGGLNGIPQSTSSFIISSSSLSKQHSALSLSNRAASGTSNNKQSPPSNSGSNVIHPNMLAQQPPSSTTITTPDQNDHTPPPKSIAANNKRTSSLRNIQNKFTNHFMTGSTSSSKLNNNSLQQKNCQTPTKLNLQNHSLRIANIQQKQAHLKSYNSSPKMIINNTNSTMKSSNTNYPTISIISQSPVKSSSLLNSASNGYQALFQRHQTEQQHITTSTVRSYASSIQKSSLDETSRVKNSKLVADCKDLIEQYDYI